MVTPDENKENEATNDGGGPQNDMSGAEIENLGWWGTMSSDHRAYNGDGDQSWIHLACQPSLAIGHYQVLLLPRKCS
jgi:hypothetical protein